VSASFLDPSIGFVVILVTARHKGQKGGLHFDVAMIRLGHDSVL
jgi:hypothetical protein